MLTLKDKKYIDETMDSKLNRQFEHYHQLYKKETEHYMSTLLEEFQGRLNTIGEVWEFRTREIVREEVTVIMDDRISPLEVKIDLFVQEMKVLRKDHNDHGHRITHLERKTA